MTVFVPRKATASQEAAAVARTRAVLPHVDVVVKRYPIARDELSMMLALHNGPTVDAG